MPPLGLDYRDSAPAGLLGMQDIENQRMRAIKEARDQAAYEEQLKNTLQQGLYSREMAPLKFFGDRAEAIQRYQPIDFQRLAQMVGPGGANLMAEAAVAARGLGNQVAPKADPNQFVIPQTPTPPADATAIGGSVAEGQAAAKGGPPKPELTPDEQIDFEILLNSVRERIPKEKPKGKRKPQGVDLKAEAEGIGIDLAASGFKSPKEREVYLDNLPSNVARVMDLATKNQAARDRIYAPDFLSGQPDEVLQELFKKARTAEELSDVQNEQNTRSLGREGRGPGSVEAGQTPEQAAQLEAQIRDEAAAREKARPLYVQPPSGYGMDTLSLARQANSIDPARYIGTQELGLAEKMIGAEAQKQAMALKSMQGTAQAKSAMEMKHEDTMAALYQKYQQATSEEHRKTIESLMRRETEMFKSLATLIKPPAPRAARAGGKTEEQEKKFVMDLIKQYKNLPRKKRRDYDALSTLNGLSFPSARAMFSEAFKSQIEEGRADEEAAAKYKNRKPQSVPGAGLPPLTPTGMKNKLINYLKDARESVPWVTWSGVSETAKANGLPQEDLDAIYQIFREKIEEEPREISRAVRLSDAR